MKRLKLIYNDHAGNRTFKNSLNTCFKIFSDAGFEDISILRTEDIPSIGEHLKQFEPDAFDTIVAAGGDGTLNAVVSAILENKMETKIGIIPAGTSNDFAKHLQIDKNFVKAAEIIANGNTIKVDVGKANDKYFINVFGAGVITNIPHHVDPSLKHTLGPLAYYLKGLEKLQDYTPMPVRITTSDSVIEEDVFFFLVLNSSRVGGFDNFVESASIKDHLFDAMAVKAGNFADIVMLILKFLRGEHIKDDRVLYFREKYVLVEPQRKGDIFETNVDGENGPDLPVEVKLYEGAIEVYVG